MRITQQLLRQIIREELIRSNLHGERITEAVKNFHGYTVRGPGDVIWSYDHMHIPKRDNPFVGGSDAFEDWYNDGAQSVSFKGVRNAGTPDQETYFGRNYVYIREWDWVLIPTLWDQTPGVAQVFKIEQKSAAGVPGAHPTDTIPVATLRFDTASGNSMENVGLAFLAKLCSNATVNGKTGRERANEKAQDYMNAHNRANDKREEQEQKRAEREMKRAEREMRNAPPPVQAAAPAAPPPRTIRRVGGVAAPPPPKKPVEMSGDELRDFLGIKRRE